MSEIHISTVQSRHWGPDDDYAVVECQVWDIPEGTPVRVTITPLTKQEYTDYIAGKVDVAGERRKA